MLLIKQISLVFTVGMLLSVPLNSYGQRLDQATEQWSEPQKIFDDRLSANSYGAIADYPTNKVFYLA